MEITRRDVLVGMGTALGSAALGCGSEETVEGVDAALAPPDDGGVVGGEDAGLVDASVDPPADAFRPDAVITAGDAAAVDAAPGDWCTEPGALTNDQLLAGIDTFVVLCMENRSFDHFLGSLRLIEGRADIDGLLGSESNPDGDGVPVPVHLLEDYTPSDPPHGWDACHQQWNGGANDGFVQAHAGASEADVMGYHVRAQLPVTYALADGGAICQRWFSAVMGPTWPNRFYLHGGSSHGIQSNLPAFNFESIFERLSDGGITNTNFFHDLPWAAGAYFKLSGNVAIEQFFERAAAGTLPQYSLIDPLFLSAGANDDHPDHDIQLGQALIGSVFAAMAQSPQWDRCMLVVTYDEHGGFFDHVAPPTTIDPENGFGQLGFRVPSLVIGPKVRRGCAIDTVLEHSSVPGTLCRRFGLPQLNARAANAADLSACLDPRFVDDPQPPPPVPPVMISRQRLEARFADPARAADPAHRELVDAVTARPLPRGLDRRGESLDIARRVLAWGERLGAVRFTP